MQLSLAITLNYIFNKEGEKETLIKSIIKSIEVICVIFICLIVIIFGIEIFLRFVFNFSFTWSYELATFLYIWFVFLGAILVTLNNSHLRMDTFFNKLPYKIRIILDFIFNLLIIWFLITLLKSSIDLISKTYSNKSPIMRIPMVIVFSCVQIFAFSAVVIYSLRIVGFLKNKIVKIVKR